MPGAEKKEGLELLGLGCVEANGPLLDSRALALAYVVLIKLELDPPTTTEF